MNEAGECGTYIIANCVICKGLFEVLVYYIKENLLEGSWCLRRLRKQMANDIEIYRRKMNREILKCMEILQTRTMANSLFVFYNLGFITGGVCNLFTSIHQVYPSLRRNIGRHARIKLAISRRITLAFASAFFYF